LDVSGSRNLICANPDVQEDAKCHLKLKHKKAFETGYATNLNHRFLKAAGRIKNLRVSCFITESFKKKRYKRIVCSPWS
jgi:hypothetical protein